MMMMMMMMTMTSASICSAESHGLVVGYKPESLKSVSGFKPIAQWRIDVGHFHILPYGRNSFAPHTGASAAILIDHQGRTVRRYACAACHGSSKYEAPGGVSAWGLNVGAVH